MKWSLRVAPIPSLLRISKSCHGAQGMEFDGRSQRVGPNHSRAATPLLNGGRSLPSRNRQLGGGETIRIKKSKCLQCPVRFEWDHQQHEILQRTRSSSSNVHWKRWEAWRVLQSKPSIKLELEKARTASKKPPKKVEIEEARKFITRSMRRLFDMEEERQVEERLLSEAHENL